MTSEGQLMTQSFMDYLLPSSHEVPEVEIVHHCTPSPLHRVRPEGFRRKRLSRRRLPRSPARSTMPSRRSAFHSTSFRSVSPRSAMPSPTRNKANRKSKPHDHRLPRPSGAAEPAGAISVAGREVSVGPPDRGRRQPRLFLCRRQADAAGVEAAERSGRPPEMDGRAEDRASGRRRLARHVRLRNSGRRRARLVAADQHASGAGRQGASRASFRSPPCRCRTARVPPRCCARRMRPASRAR